MEGLLLLIVASLALSVLAILAALVQTAAVPGLPTADQGQSSPHRRPGAVTAILGLRLGDFA